LRIGSLAGKNGNVGIHDPIDFIHVFRVLFAIPLCFRALFGFGSHIGQFYRYINISEVYPVRRGNPSILGYFPVSQKKIEAGAQIEEIRACVFKSS
jgi:hypothetical protein